MTDREAFITLLWRYYQLGRLLPAEDELPDDAEGRAEVKLVLEEMAKVKGEIEAFLAKGRRG
jgi:hypothetical protein